MTLVLRADYNTTADERINARQAIIRLVKQKAAIVLDTQDLDVRDAIVGGSAVTTTQTQLVPNVQGGSSNPAVDLVIKTATNTHVGWFITAPTADTLSDIVDSSNQTLTTEGKVFAFYGVTDFTTNGDLAALRFKSNQNVKAYIETEAIYEGSNQGISMTGGVFVDSDTGDPSAVIYGTTSKEPINVQGIWHTAVAKQTMIRTLLAEVAGTNVTGKGKQQAA